MAPTKAAESENAFKLPSKNVLGVSGGRVTRNNGVLRRPSISVGAGNKAPGSLLRVTQHGSSLNQSRLTNSFARPMGDGARWKKNADRMMHLMVFADKPSTRKETKSCDTPNPPVLAKAILQMSTTKQKSGATSSRKKGMPRSSPSSPLDIGGVIRCRRRAVTEDKATEAEAKSDAARTESDQKENEVPGVSRMLATRKPDIKKGKSLFGDVLRYCQLYDAKVSEVYESLAEADKWFESAMCEILDGELYSKFCEYQARKEKLYRELRGIESELEESVRNEMDVAASYAAYRTRRDGIRDRRRELHREYITVVGSAMNKFERDSKKASAARKIDDITRDLSDIAKKAEPPLRRSERLIAPQNDSF